VIKWKVVLRINVRSEKGKWFSATMPAPELPPGVSWHRKMKINVPGCGDYLEIDHVVVGMNGEIDVLVMDDCEYETDCFVEAVKELKKAGWVED